MPKRRRLTRRQFIGRTLTAAAALTIVPRRVLGGPGYTPPSDTLTKAVIGVGGMGRAHLAYPGATLLAVCDVDENHLKSALEISGPGVRGYRDFREVLERSDIDIVHIATPPHWHALISAAAAEAGKDIWCEKPMTRTIAEGQAVVRAVERNGRIFRVNTWFRFEDEFYGLGSDVRPVKKVVQSGLLGWPIKATVSATTGFDWKFYWSGRTNLKPEPVPPELDYDFWLGPAPRRPYNPNRSHANFRYFWDYSGGVFADFWCHITDVAYWALDLKAPKRVAATGFRDLPDDNAETPNLFEATYEYAGLVMTWTLGPAGFPGLEEYDPGCAFQGSEATLVTGYAEHAVLVKGKVVTDFPHPDPTIPDSPGHIREFLDAIKSRRPTTCNLDYAYRLTKAGLLGNIACRVNRTVEWDDGAERIVGDHEAERLTARRYRKPWRLG